VRIDSACLAGLAVALLLWCGPARAGEGRDNCTGFIDSLPASITQSGTWCLRKSLSTQIASSGLITIWANNVTLDCNGYRIEHTDPANQSGAIQTDGDNQVVRRCDVRGFYQGVHLYGLGNVVEDNRFRQIGSLAIYVQGAGSVIRRNHVFEVGNHPFNNGNATAVVAYGSADVIDNVIDTVAPAPNVDGVANATALYIYISGSGQVSGNRIRNLVSQGTGYAVGIDSFGGIVYIRRNHLVGPAHDNFGTYSIRCNGGGEQFARDNIISGFVRASSPGTASVLGCYLMGGSNIDKP
jgi:hypothetical protein